MPSHVPENGCVRAHTVGCPGTSFSGMHVLAGQLKEHVLPEGVGLVMADRLFLHGAVEQWSGTDGACAAKVLSQAVLGSKSSHCLWRNMVAGGLRDEITFSLSVAFVQTDTAVDDIRLLDDLTPAAEWSSVVDAASTMVGLHPYRPDGLETLVNCALPVPSWTGAAVERADGYRALMLLHSFTEDDEIIHIDIGPLPPDQVVLQVELCSTHFSARFDPALLRRDMTDALLRDALVLQHGDRTSLH